MLSIIGEMNSLTQSGLGSSSARDRTNEFMTTIRSLQGQQLGRNGTFNQPAAPQDRHGQLGITSILVLVLFLLICIIILQKKSYIL